jgi:hypothetical protein
MSSTIGGKNSTRSERLRHFKAVFDKRNSANEKNARTARYNAMSLDTTMIARCGLNKHLFSRRSYARIIAGIGSGLKPPSNNRDPTDGVSLGVTVGKLGANKLGDQTG